MGNRHMNRGSQSFVYKETPIKITMRYIEAHTFYLAKNMPSTKSKYRRQIEKNIYVKKFSAIPLHTL